MRDLCYNSLCENGGIAVNNKNFVYILECSDGTLYTGWTNNLHLRLDTHNSGKGAKYTRGRLPVKLMYYECYDDISSAMSREYAIKRLSRTEKLKLIDQGEFK